MKMAEYFLVEQRVLNYDNDNYKCNYNIENVVICCKNRVSLGMRRKDSTRTF